jgi:IS6 family transposase
MTTHMSDFLLKGQAAPWYYGHPQGEVRLANKIFIL